jgi:phosphotransferase system IIA component
MFETTIPRGIEQLHATMESTMARFLAQTNVRVHVVGQTCVKTIIDTAAMAALPTTVVGANVQLHIGSDPIKLGVGNGFEENATNGQEGLAHVSKVC